ncbi:hypothetical protein GPECTOR_7g1106 [Gonium pectorale]|uniref:CBM20 domain-containing protein n=1 Tax=Gonium pectorale TaxID=33097 RepID=A0A150GTY7_GONPE|nr:hypothetical protein GPECTOR_7g1106 [Gonium pectorale]|eukprot:KXZ53213.1 hypothetical protein GPECTOR_7g1106 [Gonium pectorale]
MVWSNGHQWSLECSLPQETFEFKIIVFEGHSIRWEGGSNRIVQADGDESGVPVEIVVWLTCHFNATDATGMQLAVPRASVQDAYETSKATLEFLKKRRVKLGQDTDQTTSFTERTRQEAELARLAAAVAEQSSAVDSLEGILGTAPQARQPSAGRNGAASEGDHEAEDEQAVLLLAIDSVALPRALRRISFSNVMQAWSAGPSLLSSSNGGSEGDDAAVHSPSPFLRGELESRAEDLMSAAGALLQELQGPASDGHAATDAQLRTSPYAGEEWAILAEEASQVAVALQALGGPDGEEAHGASREQLLQLQGLASVGSALAGAERGAAAGFVGTDSATTGVVVEGAGIGAAAVAAGAGAPLLMGILDGREEAAAADGVAAIDSTMAPLAAALAAKDGTGDTALSHALEGTPAFSGHAEAARQSGADTQLSPAASSLPQPTSPAPVSPRLEDLHPWQRMAASLKG